MFNRKFVLLVIIVAIFSFSSSFCSSVKITKFSDGKDIKKLTYNDGGGKQIVNLSIPKGATIKNFTMSLQGEPIIENSTWDIRTYEEFNASLRYNLSLNDELKLAYKEDWWNLSWKYRTPLTINTTMKNRTNITFEFEINFTSELSSLGMTGKAFDENSIRVVEVNNTKQEIVKSKFVKSNGYNNITNATGELYWLLNGSAKPNETIFYYVYFDTADNPKPKSSSLLEFYNDVIIVDFDTRMNIYFGEENFSKRVLIPLGGLYDIDVGDVNRDGYLDLVGSVYRVDTIGYFSRTFLGSADGISTVHNSSFDIRSSMCSGIALDDINKDGYLDAVSATELSIAGFPTATSFLFNGSKNGFSQVSNHNFPTEGADDVAIGDLNKDGYLDIVFANWYNETSYNRKSFIYYGSKNGYNFTPDVSLPTNGTVAVAIGDVNNDSYLDLVFTGAWNGSYLNKSYLYFGSQSGFNSTPDMFLNTDGALDVDIGDVNNDGLNDIVFANYNNNTSYDINSTVFYSPIKQNPDLFFKTNGSAGVFIGDVNNDGLNDIVFGNQFDDHGKTDMGTYVYLADENGLIDNSIDLVLPSIGVAHVAVADVSRYYMNLDLESPNITKNMAEGYYKKSGLLISYPTYDDGIVYVVPYWNVTSPSSAFFVFVSNDNGEKWFAMEKGVRHSFLEEGNSLMYKLEFYSDSTFTPVLKDITFYYQTVSYPSNVMIDAWDDGSFEWLKIGKLNGFVVIDETNSSLRESIDLKLPDFGTKDAIVPLAILSTTAGSLTISNLCVVLNNSKPFIKAHIPPIHFDEDEILENAFNLYTYFSDYESELNFSVYGNKNVFIDIAKNGSVSFSGKADWYGEEKVIIRAYDEEREYVEDWLDIKISPVNDPPIFSKLPDIYLKFGETREDAISLMDYVSDVDSQILYFTIITGLKGVKIDENKNLDIYPEDLWYGCATITIKVSDGFAYATSSFLLTVGAPTYAPQIAMLPTVYTKAGTNISNAFSLLDYVYDNDTSFSNLTFTILSKHPIDARIDEKFNVGIYLVDRKWYGSAEIEIKVSDGLYNTSRKFTLVVLPVTETIKVIKKDEDKTSFWLLGLTSLILGILLFYVCFDFYRKGMKIERVKKEEEVRQAIIPTETKPVLRIKCKCGVLSDVYTSVRPYNFKCKSCGKTGILR
ncbi:MAG: VCBS repeat-containing protein [Candidatus Thermoplasmatota archaeon]